MRFVTIGDDSLRFVLAATATCEAAPALLDWIRSDQGAELAVKTGFGEF